MFSNTGGIALNEIAHEYHFAGVPRDRYNITELQLALSNAAFNEAGTHRRSRFSIDERSLRLGGMFHASLIKHHLLTFFVPFLPLEREHIRECIERRLDLVFETDHSTYSLTRDEIIDQVLDQIEFFPPKSLLYSISGCKKVPQRLDFVLEHHRVEGSSSNTEL